MTKQEIKAWLESHNVKMMKDLESIKECLGVHLLSHVDFVHAEKINHRMAMIRILLSEIGE